MIAGDDGDLRNPFGVGGFFDGGPRVQEPWADLRNPFGVFDEPRWRLFPFTLTSSIDGYRYPD